MTDEGSGEKIRFGQWFVAFFDLLGVRNRYLKTDYIPPADDPAQVAELVKALKESVGTINSMRTLLARFMAAAESTTNDQVRLDSLPPDKRTLVESLRAVRITRSNVSDSVILACPLKADEDHFPLRGIFESIRACAAMMTMTLAAGKPVRGGLDIGTAMLVDGELFGAALVKAYLLESKCAKYPRMVVGESLGTYLLNMANSQPTTDRERAEQGVASHLVRCLKHDDFDQQVIVDYAGYMFRHLRENVPGLGDILEKALTFARTSRSTFDANGDKKHFERYSALVSYLEKSGPFT